MRHQINTHLGKKRKRFQYPTPLPHFVVFNVGRLQNPMKKKKNKKNKNIEPGRGGLNILFSRHLRNVCDLSWYQVVLSKIAVQTSSQVIDQLIAVLHIAARTLSFHFQIW